MSKKSVAAFIADLAKDPNLQQEMADLAAKHGYDFTSDELNDADLAGISGGVLALPEFDMVAKKKPAKK
jgi:hypothetical protein